MPDAFEFLGSNEAAAILGLVGWITFLYNTRSVWLHPILRGLGARHETLRLARVEVLRWRLLAGTRPESGESYHLYEARVDMEVENLTNGNISVRPADLNLRVEGQDRSGKTRFLLYPPAGAAARDLEPRGAALSRRPWTLTFSSGQIDGHYEKAFFYPAASKTLSGPIRFSLLLVSPSPASILFRGRLRDGSIEVQEPGTA